MHARAALVALLLLFATPVAFAAATGAPPVGAHSVSAGAFNVSYFAGPDSLTVNETVVAGEHTSLWIAVENLGANSTTRHAVATLTSSTLTFDNVTFDIVASGNDSWSYAVAAVTAPADGGAASYHLDVKVYEGNGTATLLASAVTDGAITVEGKAVVPAPGVPVGWYVGGGAVVLVAAVVIGVSMRNASVKRKMNEAPRRSQVMRDAELQRQIEKTHAKDPEQAAVIKQEIRQQEQVREKRRELQILEAKRADVLKTMDLLRKRHEAGGITKHQHDTMLAKRQADLERLDTEIAEMEAADAGGSAAA